MSGPALVLGGARSGKSLHAETLVRAHPAPWHYIATAQAFDDEMAERIALHRLRRGAGWLTHDAPLDLAGALDALGPDAPALIDCLTLWLTNLILGGHDVGAATRALVASLGRGGPTVLVANEVGLGIVPENTLARRFRDEAGRLNQRIASIAGQVTFMVAGLPMRVK